MFQIAGGIVLGVVALTVLAMAVGVLAAYEPRRRSIAEVGESRREWVNCGILILLGLWLAVCIGLFLGLAVWLADRSRPGSAYNLVRLGISAGIAAIVFLLPWLLLRTDRGLLVRWARYRARRQR